MDSPLYRGNYGLLDHAVVHFLCLYQQRIMCAVDERDECATRIHRTDDEIGIVKLCRGAIPVRLEDSNNVLYIGRVVIKEVVFAVIDVAATTSIATEGRAGEV